MLGVMIYKYLHEILHALTQIFCQLIEGIDKVSVIFKDRTLLIKKMFIFE